MLIRAPRPSIIIHAPCVEQQHRQALHSLLRRHAGLDQDELDVLTLDDQCPPCRRKLFHLCGLLYPLGGVRSGLAMHAMMDERRFSMAGITSLDALAFLLTTGQC
jgi:hypothetical protein